MAVARSCKGVSSHHLVVACLPSPARDYQSILFFGPPPIWLILTPPPPPIRNTGELSEMFCGHWQGKYLVVLDGCLEARHFFTFLLPCRLVIGQVSPLGQVQGSSVPHGSMVDDAVSDQPLRLHSISIVLEWERKVNIFLANIFNTLRNLSHRPTVEFLL